MNASERLAFYNRFYDAFFRELDERSVRDLTNEELHVLHDFLWASTDDVVSEWARRKMMDESPIPRAER